MSNTSDKCRICGKRYQPGGDGYDGLCPPCADNANEIAEQGHRWKCPKCGSDDLEVVVEISRRLVQDSDGNIQTVESRINNDEEWNENSAMTCMKCGECRISEEFQCKFTWDEVVEWLRQREVSA